MYGTILRGEGKNSHIHGWHSHAKLKKLKSQYFKGIF